MMVQPALTPIPRPTLFEAMQEVIADPLPPRIPSPGLSCALQLSIRQPVPMKKPVLKLLTAICEMLPPKLGFVLTPPFENPVIDPFLILQLSAPAAARIPIPPVEDER